VGGASKTVLISKEDRSIGTYVDDALIKAQLKNEYFSTNETIFFNVDVEVNEGRVLLTGTVETSDLRIEATRRAWGIVGVTSVLNELQISNSDSILDYADDLIISTKIRAKILLDSNINNLNFSIETVNSIVYILGIAQNQKEVNHILEIINSVYGVEEIIDYIRIIENS
jgi:osmotically-inducible protein OsmY